MSKTSRNVACIGRMKQSSAAKVWSSGFSRSPPSERGCLSRSGWLATGAWNNPERLNVRTFLRLAFSTAALRRMRYASR